MRPLQLSVPAVAALIAVSAVPADAGTPDLRRGAPVEVVDTGGAPHGDTRQERPADAVVGPGQP